MAYVIVGNGVASIGAIEGIRRLDPDGKITVISREEVESYGRPLISYLLGGKVKADRLALRPKKFYRDNKVENRLGVTVTALDAGARTLTTSDGETMGYDKLLIATGGIPFAPEVPGAEGEGVHTFTTIADAEALLDKLPSIKKAVIVGAGLIALKAAEGLCARNVDTTLLVRSRIMRTYFDETAGGLLSKHLVSKGLNLMEGANPVRVVRDASGTVTAVETDRGTVEADVVIMAAGVRPAKSLAEEAGINCEQGILVNEMLRTSASHIYAAGDCTQAKCLFSERPVVIPIWPNAYNQGFYAGINMAGGNQPYEGTLSMNSIAYFGLPTACTGEVNPPEGEDFEIFQDIDRRKKTYRKLVFKDNFLVGYVFIGEIGNAGLYTGFIRFRVPVDEGVKADLKDGRPSALKWPSEVFDQKFNPALEKAFG